MLRMNINREAVVLSISEDEARVAIAYLGGNQTRQLLSDQVNEKVMRQTVIGIELAHQKFDDPDQVMRNQLPKLFSYDLPYSHRAPLIGAFVLGIEGQEPSVPEILEGMDPEQRAAIAISARDALLAMQ